MSAWRLPIGMAVTLATFLVGIVGGNAIASPRFDPLHLIGVIAVGFWSMRIGIAVTDRLDR